MRKGRIIIEQNNEYQEINIKLIRNAYVIVPLGITALVWILGFLFLGEKVLESFHTIIELGIAGMLFFWLILGGVIFSTLYWIFTGREKLMVTSTHIQTEKPIHLYKRRRAYLLDTVSNIRIDREVFKVRRNKQWEDDQRIVIKFETPGKTVTFGRGLTDEEAEFILLELARNEFLNESHFLPLATA